MNLLISPLKVYCKTVFLGYSIPKYFLLISCLLCLLTKPIYTQTSDNNFTLPLADVVEELKLRYGIALRDPDHLVEGKTVTYALWRFKPDVDETLHDVLHSVDLFAQKEGEKKYKIKKFQYHRLTLEQGKEKLTYLSSLYNDQASWEKRKEEIKQCLPTALGIDRMPAAPNSQPILSNKREMNTYTVENIALETVEGFYVCGTIYKPRKLKGKSPVILCPNGHFGGGRYRPDHQKRCAALAMMGAITISYDLFAWGESLLQLKKEDHHRSVAMQMQTLNSIRLLDYLLTLPEADPERVAITGGSGGGSHTILISAIDDRIKVSVPVVMLSCIHYGGCPCESGMPIHLCGGGTNNPELACLFAPKPQLVVSDGGDWTKNVPEVEFPFMQRIYGFYSATDKLENAHIADEGHSYSQAKREPMYKFMANYLGLNLKAIQDKNGEIDESVVTVEPEEALYSFGNNKDNLPEDAIESIEELEELIKKYQGNDGK